MPRRRRKEPVAETPKAPVMPETPKEKVSDVPLAQSSSGALWEACSNLSSEGRTIAHPGDMIHLSKALSDFYLKTAPGSIKPAKPID